MAWMSFSVNDWSAEVLLSPLVHRLTYEPLSDLYGGRAQYCLDPDLHDCYMPQFILGQLGAEGLVSRQVRSVITGSDE